MTPRVHSLLVVPIAIAGVAMVGCIDYVTGYEVRLFPLDPKLGAAILIARLAGDEFAILLPDSGADAALSSLERVRLALATAMERNGWPITASLGAVCCTQAPASVAVAVQSADAVMYRSKRGGKNRVHLELVAGASERPSDEQA